MNNFLNAIVILIGVYTFMQSSDNLDTKRNLLSYYYKLNSHVNSGYEINYYPCDYNCIGIEMEIEFLKAYPNLNNWENFLNQKVFENKTWHDIILLKYDYSVPYGIELNFQPLTFDKVFIIEWDIFFKFLSSEKPDINLDTGLHLHISAKNTNIFKITKLLINNKDYFTKFMRRENNVYAKYCSPKQRIKDCISRLSVINYNSIINTIEIRGFKTTLNTKTFLEYISFMQKLDKFYKKN